MRLAFVDLETTGSSATADRITEIGIVSVDEHGVTEWSQLVNPETSIPPFIQSLTGISNQMVAQAPLFADLAEQVLARLDGCLFIAHNARFDHGFLKNAFKRLGYTFQPAVLCTVRLSRKLYPGFARHNLDSIIERFGLQFDQRHRALDDARLLWQFWQKIHQTLPADQVRQSIKELTGRPSLPPHLDSEVIARLPNCAGVYLFYGENQLPLYVGKAVNLRRRVLSHFSGDHLTSKELEISQQLRRIEWIETAGELGALLTEARLVKKLQPVYNRQLRACEQVCAWRLVIDGEKLRLSVVLPNDLFFAHDAHLFGPFIDKRNARAMLRSLADAHHLCRGVLGLEKIQAGKPCFASQLKRCHGVCTGVESAHAHIERVLLALEPYRLPAWPFSGAIGIREGDALHLAQDWRYLETVPAQSTPRVVPGACSEFDYDIYYLLKKYLLGQADIEVEELC